MVIGTDLARELGVTSATSCLTSVTGAGVLNHQWHLRSRQSLGVNMRSVTCGAAHRTGHIGLIGGATALEVTDRVGLGIQFTSNGDPRPRRLSVAFGIASVLV